MLFLLALLGLAASAFADPGDCPSNEVTTLTFDNDGTGPAFVEIYPESNPDEWSFYNFTSAFDSTCISYVVDSDIHFLQHPTARLDFGVCVSSGCPSSSCHANNMGTGNLTASNRQEDGMTPQDSAVQGEDDWFFIGVHAVITPNTTDNPQVSIRLQQHHCGATISPTGEPTPTGKVTVTPFPNSPTPVPKVTVTPHETPRPIVQYEKTGVSKGVAAFLFFLGLGVGCAGFFGYMYYKTRVANRMPLLNQS